MKFFMDTSSIINGGLKIYKNIWITPLVLTELENIKTSNKPEHIKYLAREAVRDIIYNNNVMMYYPSEKKIEKFIKKHDFLENINDHKLLASAELLYEEQEESVIFVTSDASLYLFAQIINNIGAHFLEPEPKLKKINDYKGWRKVTPTDDELIELYSHPENNIFHAKINEFIEIYVEEELKDIQIWNGEHYRGINYKEFKSPLGEKIKPRNLEQKMYLDLLQNRDIPIKLCVAKFGTGKSFLALNYALHEVHIGRFDKIVFVKNNLEVKGAGHLGTLPGDEISKQYPWLRQIEDHIGIQKFEEYLESGIIEPAHLSTLRGRDFKNSIILVDEAENLLTTNIQLLLGRVGENSEIIFCADVKQCDYNSNKMSGIPKMIERLVDNKLFGIVKLLHTERSAVAATADLMD